MENILSIVVLDKRGTTIVLMILWVFNLLIEMNKWRWKGTAISFISKQNNWIFCRLYTTLVCLYPFFEGVLTRGALCCLDPKIWLFALGRTFPHLRGQDISLIGTFFIWYKKVLKRKADSWPMSIEQIFFFCRMQPWYECVHYFASLPLCIHGNRCLNGSATSKWTMSSHTCCLLNHWKVQISISVSWLSKESQDSSMMGYPVIL